MVNRARTLGTRYATAPADKEKGVGFRPAPYSATTTAIAGGQNCFKARKSYRFEV